VEGAEQKQTACYDIDVEVDDTLKTQMNNFLLSTASQQEIQVNRISLQDVMKCDNMLREPCCLCLEETGRTPVICFVVNF